MKLNGWEPTITMGIAGIMYTMFYLLGQAVETAVPSVLPDLGQIVANLGVVGTLVWYLYHNTTKTIPDLTDKYTKAIDEMNERHLQSLVEERERFAKVLAEEREFRRAEIEKLSYLIKAEAACKLSPPPGN